MRKLVLLLTSAALAATAVAASAASAPPRVASRCFSSTQWDGWKSPSPDVLLLGVNRDVYRADLSSPSYGLRSPGNYLVSQVRGGTQICSAIDLDLKVADSMGYREPLFIKSLRPLTREEIAALPKRDDPR